MPSRAESLEHVYHSAEFLARQGHYDLAIEVLRKALIDARVDAHVGRAADAAADARAAGIEAQIESQYAAYRTKYEDDRQPWKQTLARTGIIAGIFAVTFFVCFTFAMYRLDAWIASPVAQVTTILDGAVKSELPKMTNQFLAVVPEVSGQMNKEIQNVGLRFSEYLEKRVDAALDERITAIVDERLKARLDGQK